MIAAAPSYHSRPFLSSALLISLMGAPLLGVSQLKFFLPLLFFGLLLYYLTALKAKFISKRTLSVTLIFSTFISAWLLKHLFFDGLDARYFLYFSYFIITFFIFILAIELFSTLSKQTVINLLFFVSLFTLFLATVEFVLNFSLLTLIPLSGSGHQIGGGAWSNVNTNIVSVFIASMAILLLGDKKRFYALACYALLLGIALDAKIGVLCILLQLAVIALLQSSLARIAALFFMAIIVPVLLFAFSEQVGVIYRALIKANDLLAQPELIRDLAESGQMFSSAIRIYALLVMFDALETFNALDWLLGQGLGSINIQFKNVNWNEPVEYFSPHFFYIEMLVYMGLAYYLFYYCVIKAYVQRFPWRQLLFTAPVWGSVVAISSAVYYPPIYLFLALLVYQQMTKELRETGHHD